MFFVEMQFEYFGLEYNQIGSENALLLTSFPESKSSMNFTTPSKTAYTAS